MAVRILFLVLCLEAVSAISARRNPVTDTMEGIGNTAGTVQDGTSTATGAVGADQVGAAAGGAVTGAGGAVGGVASDLGATPDQVEVLGASGEINPVSTALKCVINLTIQYMGIYTACAILRVVADFQGVNANSWTVYEALVQAQITVNYA